MAFPTTAAIDTFNRANETPLGPPWQPRLEWSNVELNLFSNTAVDSAAGGCSASGLNSIVGPDLEAWGIFQNAHAAGDYTELDLATTVNPPDGTIVGFFVYTARVGSTYEVTLQRLDAGVGTTLITYAPSSIDSGDGVGVRRVGSAWTLYFRDGGVWTVVGSVADANYMVPLYPTIGLCSTQVAWDEVGGGTLSYTPPATPPSTGPRPVVTGSGSQARSSSLAALPFSHTVPSGTGALLVYVAQESFFQPLATVTWGGVTVPLLNAHQPINIQPWTYLLLNPTPGTQNIVVTPDLGQVLFVSITASAVNIANYGGIRFSDWAYSNLSPLDPPVYTPNSRMHTESTDLVLSAISQLMGGATFTPVGMSIVVAQNGLGDSAVKMAVGQTDSTGLSTTIDWTLLDNHVFMVHMMAIKRLDGTPSGVHEAIGPVTNTFATEEQPTPALLPLDPPPGDYWHWWHTVPSTHRTLVVALMTSDAATPVTSVTFNGVELSPYYQAANQYFVYILENAPIGTHLVEVRQLGRRYFMAGAYSLSTSGLIAATSAGGFAPTLTVASQPDAVAILMADYPYKEPYLTFTYAPVVGTMLWDQPLYVNSNTIEGNRPNINDTVDHGFSFYRIASGATVDMTWTVDPPLWVNGRIAFSFIPVTPIPPETDTGCPNTLGPIPEGGGTGCSTTLPTG